MVLAAVGRVQLAEARELPAPCLAALAEVSLDHLRLLTRRGALPSLRDSARTGLRYPCHVARAHLLQQRVPGIEALPAVGARVRVLGHDARPLRLHPPPPVPPPRIGEAGTVTRLAAHDALAVRFDDGATHTVPVRFVARAHEATDAPPALG
jgi:hypothetical protein